MNVCRVPGCDLKAYGQKLCQKHYMRQRRLGHDRFKEFGMYNTAEEKFWLSVDKSGECWNWTRPLDEDGYGRFQVGRVAWKTHRFAVTITHGPIPSGMEIDHMCHNRACVNPSHLRTVTSKQNSENRSGPVKSRSKTGVRGVYMDRESGKYRVAVGHNRKLHHGGYYTSLAEATSAAMDLRNRLFTHNDMDRNIMKEQAA